MAVERIDRVVSLVKPCFQCGTCSAGCPVFRNNYNKNPRLLINRLLQGQTEEVLRNQDAWNCCFCLTCSERCPQNVDLAHILVDLKNHSANEGKAPEAIVNEMKMIKQTGMTLEISKMVLKRRGKMSLPEILLPKLEEIQKILKATGFDEQLKLNLGTQQITETSEEEVQ